MARQFRSDKDETRSNRDAIPQTDTENTMDRKREQRGSFEETGRTFIFKIGKRQERQPGQFKTHRTLKGGGKKGIKE